MTKTKQRKRTGLHREGRRMLLIVCLVVFILNITAYFYWPHWILATLLALSALALVFVVYFFRDPVRVFTINDPNYLVAPADGTVVVIEPVMENEYFMDWVRFCWQLEREKHIDGLARKPLCRCITEAGELRRRYRRMTREQRCEAAREAIYGLMPQNDLRLPSLVALCILINEYHEDMEDDILCSLRTYLCYQPSEKFEYIVIMEAGPEIDRAWLSESFLSMFRTLGVRIEAQEERRCRSVVNR